MSTTSRLSVSFDWILGIEKFPFLSLFQFRLQRCVQRSYFFRQFFFHSLYRCISTPNKVNRIFSNRYFVSLIMQTRRDFSSDYHSFTVYPIRIMIWYSEEFSIDFWSSHEMVECDRTCWGIKWNNGLQIRARCELIYLKLFFPDCEAYLNVLMRKKHTFTGKW